MRRTALAATAAIAAALALAAGASSASAAEWQAAYVNQCCYMTLESGETAVNWFDVKNVGTQTWDRSFVRLGTDAPHDRNSVFYNPADWISPNRATALDQQTLAPNQVGRFTFVVKAPSVSQQTGYQERFEPVAEGHNWMCGPGWNCGNVFLEYQVVPSIPPSVQISSAPASVQVGDPVKVAASATDNHAMARVDFTLEGQTKAVTAPNGGPNTYGTALSSAGLEPGTHQVVAAAYDRAGNRSTSSATFTVYPKPEQPVPTPVTSRSTSGKPLKKHGKHLLITVTPYWTWTKDRTRLIKAVISQRAKGSSKSSKLSKGASILTSCKGKKCPHGLLLAHSVKGFLKPLRKREFRPGTRLSVTVFVPGHTPTRFKFTTRAGQAPSARAIK